MAPKRKAAVAAVKRIKGERPALKADVQEPPKKKRKVAKATARNAKPKPKKAVNNVPKDMLDDPEMLVRKERWVWKPQPQPARCSLSYDDMCMPGHYGFRPIRDTFGARWQTRWWQPRAQLRNDFAVDDDESGPELERAPPRADPKILEVLALPLSKPNGMTVYTHLPTSWHGTFDLFPTDANTKVPEDLDIWQWELEQRDALDTMRLSLGWDTDLLAPDEALDIDKDNIPAVGVLCGSPLSVGKVEEMLRSCGVTDAQDIVLPWSEDACSIDSVPLVVTHGRVEKLAFRPAPSCCWGADDGYIAKLQFPAKNILLYDNDQVVIMGEGGIKLHKRWEQYDVDSANESRWRELFAGHFEFTVFVKNKREPQNFVSKTLHRNFYGIRSKASMSFEHPAFLGLSRVALQSILPLPYDGSTPAFPIPRSLTSTPDQPLPPLDFRGNFWFAFPHNKGFLYRNNAAIPMLSDVHMREKPEETGLPAINIPLDRICPDPEKLERAYERVHAEFMWTIDNSKLGWLDGYVELEEGTPDGLPERGHCPPGSTEPVACGVGVGLRGRFSLGFDLNSKLSRSLQNILHGGLKVVNGHVGPVHFPLNHRPGYNALHSSYDRNSDLDIPDPQPEARWEHGLQARLQLVGDKGDHTRGQGTLKMRRAWAYAFPGNDRYGAMDGELFEGWYEFELHDEKNATYERASDTFFAVRWRDGEKKEGKRDLAEQKLEYSPRMERWRMKQVTVPYEEGPVPWESDKAPATFHCYRHKIEESDWSLQEPPPSMNNFFRWLNIRIGEKQELDWGHPPEPDPRTPRTNVKVKLIVRAPQKTKPEQSIDGRIPSPDLDSL